SKDRTGKIHGPFSYQQDFGLQADGQVYLGGLYRVVGGLLTVPSDTAAQDGCITVMAMRRGNNQGGQDGAKKVRCMVLGIALMPVGDLTVAAVGKPVYPMEDDGVSASAPTEVGNRPAGVLLTIDGSIAKVLLR
ncbi:MAG: hypothetical protein AAGC55_31995, partial [Myxococcota bacterium]